MWLDRDLKVCGLSRIDKVIKDKQAILSVWAYAEPCIEKGWQCAPQSKSPLKVFKNEAKC